ncbi:MAG: AAA family ATPase [Actinomycetota bacterium]|nr:AAA family ATPase [Actinomycetota bacterium]
MGDDSVLTAERAHLDVARVCLVRMQRSASAIADYGVDELASQSLGRMRSRRMRALAADPDAPPFFGRTDRDAEAGSGIETFHIGRRHVRDDSGDPVVIDWRAPIARAFYRATPTDRMGVRLRRRFGFHDGRLTSFEDEHLDHGESLGLHSDLLREEIERPRVGPMRDIVATIQPDQDDLVRADLDTSICIQGAPGTGKTAVGLHRAAYLLYTYPERLRRSGVLVVGPNRAFLHYIAQVLPSLGEGGIEQATVGELMPWPARAAEPAELATLKGDARMAEVLRRAVLSHVAKPVEDVVSIVGTKRYRIGAHHLRRYVDDARRAVSSGGSAGSESRGTPADGGVAAGGPAAGGGAAAGGGLRWSIARERLRSQVAEDVRRQREDAGGAPSDADTAKVARSRAVREFLDQVWPALSAPALLSRLYADVDFLRRCSATTLSAEERASLARPSPRSLSATRWTAADTVLLDELEGLLVGGASYVHAVVDEAQDLSAMQCRAIARRCPTGSVTVLGDLAQATSASAPGDWAVTLRHLGHGGAQIRPLTIGYRVPGEVLEIANRLLPHIAVGVPPATSIRQGVDALRFAPLSALVDEVRRCLAVEGSIGVIVPDDRASDVLSELTQAGIAAELIDDDTDPRVSVVPAAEAKGLEFDSVVLVEPAAIVAGESTRAAGLRRLYVVLTRAVSRLAVLHDEPLPAELT